MGVGKAPLLSLPGTICCAWLAASSNEESANMTNEPLSEEAAREGKKEEATDCGSDEGTDNDRGG